MLNLLLLICLHGNFDLPVATEWFCNWCSLTQNVDVESAFAMWILQMFFEVFVGVGLKLHKYESRAFNLCRISYFAV